RKDRFPAAEAKDPEILFPPFPAQAYPDLSDKYNWAYDKFHIPPVSLLYPPLHIPTRICGRSCRLSRTSARKCCCLRNSGWKILLYSFLLHFPLPPEPPGSVFSFLPDRSDQ